MQMGLNGVNPMFNQPPLNMEEGSSSESFWFAFNDTDFSDRLLHIQILSDEVSSTPELKKLKYSLISSPPPTQTDVSDCCAEIQLKSLYLSSPILAAKSPFFYKLFKNGMSESQQKEATLRIHSSEETALMDLLKFMYTNTLSANTFSDLVDVFMAADKFEVKSCVKHCIELLLKMPMSLQSALSYLDLPSTVLAARPLIDASKEYLVAHFKDFHKSKKEAISLPLDALEIVLGSESLRVNSEDDVYKFILEWVQSHYPKLEERQEILNKQLVQFISFPYMSFSMLRKALVCPDFNSKQVSELVMDALFQKGEVFSKYFTTTKTRRLYNYRPVKLVPVEFSLPRFIIYFNLKKEDCRTLVPKNDIFSEDFFIGSQMLYFGAEISNSEGSSSQKFAIYIHVDKESELHISTLNIELAVMKKLSDKYEVQGKFHDLVLSELEEGGSKWCNLFQIPWSTFISDESEYFVDGILHVRAELTITKSLP